MKKFCKKNRSIEKLLVQKVIFKGDNGDNPVKQFCTTTAQAPFAKKGYNPEKMFCSKITSDHRKLLWKKMLLKANNPVKRSGKKKCGIASSIYNLIDFLHLMKHVQSYAIYVISHHLSMNCCMRLTGVPHGTPKCNQIALWNDHFQPCCLIYERLP